MDKLLDTFETFRLLALVAVVYCIAFVLTIAYPLLIVFGFIGAVGAGIAVAVYLVRLLGGI